MGYDASLRPLCTIFSAGATSDLASQPTSFAAFAPFLEAPEAEARARVLRQDGAAGGWVTCGIRPRKNAADGTGQRCWPRCGGWIGQSPVAEGLAG